MAQVYDREDYAVAVDAKTKQGELERLLSIQGSTRELIEVLETRLQPVATPQPIEASDSRGVGFHINAAVDAQNDINKQLRYLIDTLVI